MGSDPFENLDYDRWVSGAIGDRWHTLDDALASLEADLDPIASYAVFWQCFAHGGDLLMGLHRTELSDDTAAAIAEANVPRRADIAERLGVIAGACAPERSGDDTLEHREVWTYLHAAGAFALLLEWMGQTATERHWEMVEQAVAVGSLPRTSPIFGSEELPEVELSAYLISAWLRAKLSRSAFSAGDLEEMIGHFRGASEAAVAFDEALLRWNEDPLEAEVWVRDEPDDLPGPACIGIGFYLILHEFDAEEFVAGLERTFEHPAVNWRLLEASLLQIEEAWAYTAPDVSVDPKNRVLGETFKSYLRYAMGRVQQKLTPDELQAALERDRERSSEKALDLYFFPTQWISLSDETKRALVSADLEYRAASGSRGIVPDRLRAAVREVLHDRVWRRYVSWLSARPTKTRDELDVLATGRDPDLGAMLFMWRTTGFRDFIDVTFPQFGKGGLSIDEMYDWLDSLNYAANAPRHQHHRPTLDFEQSVKAQFQRVLGIGQRGILAQLLSIKPADGHEGES